MFCGIWPVLGTWHQSSSKDTKKKLLVWLILSCLLHGTYVWLFFSELADDTATLLIEGDVSKSAHEDAPVVWYRPPPPVEPPAPIQPAIPPESIVNAPVQTPLTTKKQAPSPPAPVISLPVPMPEQTHEPSSVVPTEEPKDPVAQAVDPLPIKSPKAITTTDANPQTLAEKYGLTVPAQPIKTTSQKRGMGGFLASMLKRAQKASALEDQARMPAKIEQAFLAYENQIRTFVCPRIIDGSTGPFMPVPLPVSVRIVIDRQGNARSVVITKSSGIGTVDNFVRKSLMDFAPYPVVPALFRVATYTMDMSFYISSERLTQ